MESVFISKIQHKHPTENPSIFHRELGNYVFLSPDRALSYDNHQLRIVGGIDLFEAMLQQIQLACQDVDKLSIGDTITCQGRSVIPEAVYGGIWWDSSAALGDPLPSHHFPSLRRWTQGTVVEDGLGQGIVALLPSFQDIHRHTWRHRQTWEDGNDGSISPPGTWKKNQVGDGLPSGKLT